MPFDALHADSTPRPAYRRGLFVLALTLAASVFPLIWMGGLVTSHGVGLSVPDWPNSYGYNMFLFPPSRWLGGIFYEHTHRLLGTLSGFLSIAMVMVAWGPAAGPTGRRRWFTATLVLLVLTVVAITATVVVRTAFKPSATDLSAVPGVVQQVVAEADAESFRAFAYRMLPHVCVGFGSFALVAAMASFCRRREPRQWVRWMTIVSLIAVCIQGTLGGLRVDLVSRELAIVHGCFAQAFFALAVVQALVFSRWWLAADDRRPAFNAAGRFAFGLACLTTAVIYGQLIAGALMRHNGAGLAIPDVLVYGHVLPPTDAAGLDAANAARAWNYELPPVTLTQIWLHFAHRCGALVVTATVLTTAGYVFQKLGLWRAAGRVAAILCALLVTQVTLGVLTVYLRKPADVASMHVAVGALTLVTAALLAAVLGRQYAGRPVVAVVRARPEPAELLSV